MRHEMPRDAPRDAQEQLAERGRWRRVQHAGLYYYIWSF